MHYRRIAQLRTPNDFRNYVHTLAVNLPFDEEMDVGPKAPLAQPLKYRDIAIGNRFAVLPMEGWDAGSDGSVTELVERRWQHFGQSGAKLIWGGEAVAVRHDGRANPRQLVINQENIAGLAALRESLIQAHHEKFQNTDDLLIGLQLTHSGRFARPVDQKRMEPQILYHHPILDRKFHLPSDHPLMTDDQISYLIEDFIRAAVLAQKAGFQFVDIKHCHGYLGHEFLTAIDRTGRYGGSFENRTRFLREVTAGIRAAAPSLDIGVRLSAFDWIPFRPGSSGTGEPEIIHNDHYAYAFGSTPDGLGIDLTEPNMFLNLLRDLDIQLVCITAGSPYYNPHIQRPALFPPSDGYQPPEDPLAGVARQISVVEQLKATHPHLVFVGSGYSYLQEWLPHVAQHVVRTDKTDFVGLGRMILTYPDLVADILSGAPLQRKRICRTFSDCTTAPRKGLVSGCYPLDEFYKNHNDAAKLAGIKAAQ